MSAISSPCQRAFTAILWLAVVGAGFGFSWRYESTPGKPAAASAWPATSTLERDAERPTVVSFVHPSCPCTRAGLQQLAELDRRDPGGARWIFVIVGEAGFAEDLTQSENARLARSIDGAILLDDPRGVEARGFGAATSGQTFAYTPEGALAFRGGVTAARGHLGPNPGLDSLRRIMAGEPTTITKTPVFGCPLAQETR